MCLEKRKNDLDSSGTNGSTELYVPPDTHTETTHQSTLKRNMEQHKNQEKRIRAFCELRFVLARKGRYPPPLLCPARFLPRLSPNPLLCTCMPLLPAHSHELCWLFFHCHPLFPNHRHAELFVTVAPKSAPKSLAQCKHVQGGLATR